ncbi:uncharacterized protein LOC112085223 [Eutrema salsugineum]|uniref:uncharacterized protein LOC112085223 n=1 Tax=Eutrema salsugineum TaxID=72664 RepID=UPI000CECEA9E|nr:uncharacterized protein LOC112085223 [Eutrema salsugineum]
MRSSGVYGKHTTVIQGTLWGNEMVKQKPDNDKRDDNVVAQLMANITSAGSIIRTEAAAGKSVMEEMGEVNQRSDQGTLEPDPQVTVMSYVNLLNDGPNSDDGFMGSINARQWFILNGTDAHCCEWSTMQILEL